MSVSRGTRDKKFAVVCWLIDDVVATAADEGMKMTKKQAQKFLSEIEIEIADAMVSAGSSVILDRLEDYCRSEGSPGGRA